MNFMRFKWLYFLISGIFLVPGIFSLLKWGLKPAIDFSGGTILEVRIQKQDVEINNKKIEDLIRKEIEISTIQRSGDKTLILKTKTIDRNKKDKILAVLKEEVGEVEEVRFETVGPTIGKELIKKTIIAIILATSFILLYVASRFKDKKYGFCAILAMFHDTFILLGTFSILGHFFKVEVDTLFVTAVLTILSFSVHDTIVVYDRIRESVKTSPKARFVDLVNKAVVETLNRSIINSLTIIFMLLCLWLFGGETIKWFVLALLIGTISGTYSSTFTAAPLLVVWNQLQNQKKDFKAV